MGFIGKMFKGAVAAKAVSVARKPENQARAKSAFRSLRAKVSGGSATPAAKTSRRGRKQAPVTGRPSKSGNRTR